MFSNFIHRSLILFFLMCCSSGAHAQFNYSVYDGSFNALPDFSTLTPIATGQSDTIGVSVTNQVDTFGLVFTNKLTIIATGEYTFTTSSDDGSRLYIGEQLVADNDGIHGYKTVSGSIWLAEGIYPLRVEYFESTGGQSLNVSYSIFGSSKQVIPANGVLALQPSTNFEYSVYDGSFTSMPDFSTLTPIATGQSDTIDLSVTDQIDTFGLVFTNTVFIKATGEYTFTTSSDDGSRLYIGEQLVVDNDGIHGNKSVSGSIRLKKGTYSLRVEYFEKTGGQALNVSYALVGTPPQPIPSNGYLIPAQIGGFAYSVYDGEFLVLPDFDTLTPIATGQSLSIDLDVTSQVDTFGLVFTGAVTVPLAGKYTFKISSDDGSRLYIDEQVVIDNDGIHGPTPISGTVYLESGIYPLRVEYFEKTGGQSLDVSYSFYGTTPRKIPGNGFLSPALSSGFDYRVYDGDFNKLPDFSALTPIAEGRSSQVNVGVTSEVDTFGLVFANTLVVPAAGDYEFTLYSDDGSRLYIGDQLVIDNDGIHGELLRTGSINLSEGTHPLRIEYFEKSAGQVLVVNYRFNGSPLAPIPANGYLDGATNTEFSYRVYDGDFTVLPNFAALTPISSGQTDVISLNVTSQTDTFALVFTNTIRVAKSGEYRFNVSSDDGARIYIGDQLVVDNDGIRSRTSASGSLYLQPGFYPIRVEYFERSGNQALVVTYASNSGPASPIPANSALAFTPAESKKVGAWGPVIAWPEIAVSGANLPDGRVLTWASVTETGTGGGPSPDYSHASIFDPATNTFETTDNNFHNMFCAGVSMLENGTVVASGGGATVDKTSAFDLTSLKWSPLENMNSKRWYPTNVTMPDNRVFSGFAKGAGNKTEIYDSVTDNWTTLSNVNMQTMLDEQNVVNAGDTPTGGTTMQWLAHYSVTPKGDVFSGGPTPTWQRFHPANNLDNVDFGKPSGERARMFGNTVTYDVGKVILLGGADKRLEVPSTNNAYLVDLNGPTPVITQAPSMNFARTFSNSMALPNGEVLVIGGTTAGQLFSDEGAVLPAEIYNPQTNSWRIVDSLTIPRNYHSTAFLLKDGRVLSAGGGLCGGCAANHQDGQIYSPAYLFNDDNTLATRPVLSGVPSKANAAQQITVQASNSSTAFSMIRLSGHTHHVNTDHRFVPVDFTSNGSGSFTLDLNPNPNVLIPGYYWLFALNADGTPSIGQTIQVIREPIDSDGVDADGDGFSDATDAFPNDPTEWLDSDGDGVGNNADAFPNDATETTDSDGDGVGDNADAFPNDPARTVNGQVTALPEMPRNSSTIIVESLTGSDRIWNVNPDNDSVSVVSAQGVVLAEIAVGNNPWSLAVSSAIKRVFVTNKLSATISVIDVNSLKVIKTVELARHSQPHGIVFNRDGSEYFLVLEASAVLEKRATASHELLASLPLLGTPRHLSMTFDDATVLVSNFITPPIPGESTANVNVAAAKAEVFVVDSNTLSLSSTATLSHDNRSVSESQGPGMPNYLAAPVISFNDSFAYIPSKKDNVDSGALRQKPGMTFEFTVRANTSRLALNSMAEDTSFRVDHDNSSVATGAALSGDNRYLLVTLETSRELVIYDTQLGFQVSRLPTGRAPQSVALSSDGGRAYVHNFMDRSVSRFDLSKLLITGRPSDAAILSTINVVNNESLTATVLLGKQHFYDAADDRLARDNYMSCAACHKEGKQDGRVWDFTSLGEGVRNTTSLRGKAGMAQGRPHWTGNFDELQDFERQIRVFAGGRGLMSDADFNAGDRSQPLGAPKAGVSSDLDALAAYLSSLNNSEESPQRPDNGISLQAQLGKKIFINNGCSSCHSGSLYTDSVSGQRHAVGTGTANSGTRSGQSLDGFDTPSLLGLWSSAPYLHNGSALTLKDAISAHDSASTLTETELEQLAQYLLELSSGDTLGSDVPPVANPDTINASGARVLINVLANDAGNNLSLIAPNSWSWKGGKVELSNNRLAYTAKSGFNGTDKIWYSMKDAQGRESWSVVTITVSGNNASNNPLPVGTADTLSATAGVAKTIDVLANDIGNGLNLTAPNAWSLEGGTVALVSNKIRYTPKSSYRGEDKIWYTFTDIENREAWSVVTINVTP